MENDMVSRVEALECCIKEVMDMKSKLEKMQVVQAFWMLGVQIKLSTFFPFIQNK